MGFELIVVGVFLEQFFLAGAWHWETAVSLSHSRAYESMEDCEEAKARLSDDIAAMLERSLPGNERLMLSGEGGLYRFESRADCYALHS